MSRRITSGETHMWIDRDNLREIVLHIDGDPFHFSILLPNDAAAELAAEIDRHLPEDHHAD